MIALAALLAVVAVGDVARPARRFVSAMGCTTARCSCVRSSDVGSARKRARDVALVEPIARRDTTSAVASLGGRVWPAYIVTLRVHARWKGARTDTLQVLTMQSDGLCGVSFEMGERYVVFTDEVIGMPTVQACSLTALASQASSTLRALGPAPRRR
jgi:hypothetical protein